MKDTFSSIISFSVVLSCLIMLAIQWSTRLVSELLKWILTPSDCAGTFDIKLPQAPVDDFRQCIQLHLECDEVGWAWPGLCQRERGV